MKKFFLILLLSITTFFTSSAQFDDRFYFPSKEWNKIENIEYEDLFFDIDSIRLNVILLKPENKPNTTIIFFHGAGGNISSYMYVTKPLVDAGYQVIMLDSRGYGKSTGKPTHINIANDAQIIFNSVIEKKEVKNTHIIIYGASMGTQVAVKIAKDNQAKVSGLILDGTISSFTDMALLSAPVEQKPMIEQYVTSPYSAKEDIKEIKSMPKLIIHSKEDKSVPFSQGEIVFKNASQPKEMWVYEGEHLESAIKYPELFIQKINILAKNRKDISGQEKYHTLNITISNLNSNEGQILLKLNDQSGNKIAGITKKIENNNCNIFIDNIKSGKYTIQYFHDENSNKKLDTNQNGMPTEGYGFSNNISGMYGPPSKEDQLMNISENMSIVLNPEYLNF